jgi:flagellar biosynthesis/type III secretory pathway protein FliH
MEANGGANAMSLFLLAVTEGQAVGSSSALIKAHERQDFETALQLLAASQIRQKESQAAFEAARKAGYEQGLVAGQQAVEQSFLDQAANSAKQIVAHAEQRQREIAEAALAATKAILGSVEPDVLVPAMVDQVMGRIDSGNPVTILIHPMHADAISTRLLGNSDIEITADPAFGPTDCEIITADGRIVASLSVQIETLSQRWGVAPGEMA